MVVEKIQRKEHLTLEGLRQIVAIRASMNRGLSEKLKLSFPDVFPVERPLVELPKTIDPNWLAGFTSGEGSFIINIFKGTTKIGWIVKLEFKLTQHKRDEFLMKNLINVFECGGVFRDGIAFNFRVTNLDEIVNKIIPFLKKHPIRGVKALDFADWCEVAEMMKNKEHLTPEGLSKIKKIKAGMNKGRKII